MSLDIYQSQMEDEIRNLNTFQKGNSPYLQLVFLSIDMKKLVESRQKLLEQQSETQLVKRVGFGFKLFDRKEYYRNLISWRKEQKFINSSDPL